MQTQASVYVVLLMHNLISIDTYKHVFLSEISNITGRMKN